MNRPKRIYKAPNGRFYYLLKGERKFVKVVPYNKKYIIKSKKKPPPRKKPAVKRKKTAFALNPKVPLKIEAPPKIEPPIVKRKKPTTYTFTPKVPLKIEQPQLGLPAVIPIEQKPIVSIQDVAKQEITKKAIETTKKAKEKKEEEDKKNLLDASIRPNYKVKRTIDTLFQRYKDLTGYDNVSERYAWKKYQKTKEYNNPINDEGDDSIYSIKAPYLYDYEPVLRDEDKKKEETKKPRGRKVFRSRDTEKEALSDVSTDPSMSDLLKEGFLSESDSETKSLTEGRGPNGLFNTDIEDIMKGLKNVCPVIPSDKIGMLLDYVKQGMPKFGAIINTNPSESDGSGIDGFRLGHWRAIFFDNDDDYISAEYFDPLCEGPIPAPLKAMMKKIAKKMNPEDYFLLKENHLKRQMDTTNTCGYHCIKFIDDRYNDVPWCEATGYDDYMAKHKPDDSEAGEKALIKPIRKYDKYI